MGISAIGPQVTNPFQAAQYFRQNPSAAQALGVTSPEQAAAAARNPNFAAQWTKNSPLFNFANSGTGNADSFVSSNSNNSDKAGEKRLDGELAKKLGIQPYPGLARMYGITSIDQVQQNN